MLCRVVTGRIAGIKSHWSLFICGAICVILPASMPAGALEDRISMRWEGEQYLLGSHKIPEWLIVLVVAHLGCPGKRAVKRVCCHCWFYASHRGSQKAVNGDASELLCCVARSPTNVTVVGGTGPATAPRAVSSHTTSELAPNAANVMTAWTDKLYTENMGIIFTNAVTPSAVASSAGMVVAAAAAASSASGSSGISAGGGMLMNNGRQDTSLADIQKLQQQLQDIKDQVCDSHC